MLWICADDGVAFSVGAPCCPECGGIEYRPEGEGMGPVYSTLTGKAVSGKKAARQAQSALVGEQGPELINLPPGTEVNPKLDLDG